MLADLLICGFLVGTVGTVGTSSPDLRLSCSDPSLRSRNGRNGSARPASRDGRREVKSRPPTPSLQKGGAHAARMVLRYFLGIEEISNRAATWHEQRGLDVRPVALAGRSLVERAAIVTRTMFSRAYTSVHRRPKREVYRRPELSSVGPNFFSWPTSGQPQNGPTAMEATNAKQKSRRRLASDK